MSRFILPGGAVALSALLLARPAAAQQSLDLPEVTAAAPAAGSLTGPSVAAQREALDRTAGSVGFVDTETLRDRYTGTLREVLEDTPGVLIQQRYGQELRLSVRGSGIARAYHLRGIEVLQDGIPVNLADGSGDFYQIDPLSLRSLEVYRGGNALRFGSSTLGGAVDAITPTAFTAVAPNVFRLEGGSFGTLRANAEVSRILGDADALLGTTVTHSDGYRRHSRGQSEQVNGNVGYRISPDVETRFYVGAYVVQQQLPGSLSLYDALHHPRSANPTALSGNQSRETWTERLANRTTVRLGSGQLDIDVWGIHKSLFHPIFQVIDQDGWTYGIAPRYTGSLTVAGLRNEIVAGGRIFAGDNTAEQFVNVHGYRGAQTLNAHQYARNYELYGENRLYVLPTLALVVGAKLFHDEREYTNPAGYSASPRPFDLSRTYEGFNPKLGLLWTPLPDVQFFTDITRSADVPDFTDLTQTTATSTSFVPLASQRAWTVEAGTRGRYGWLGWDVTAYHSAVRGQLLQFTTAGSDIPASTFNAGRTVLQGIEFGLTADVVRDAFAQGDRLVLGQVWNWSDFHFQNDQQYRNNRLPVAPEHVLHTTLFYRHPSGAYGGPVVDWVPRGPWADYANTLRAPGYTLLGFRAGIDFPNGLSLYVDARNVTNKHYVSDIGAVTNASLPGTNTQVFYPGDGASVFGGARLAF